jgi:hypothetical protein
LRNGERNYRTIKQIQRFLSSPEVARSAPRKNVRGGRLAGRIVPIYRRIAEVMSVGCARETRAPRRVDERVVAFFIRVSTTVEVTKPLNRWKLYRKVLRDHATDGRW